MSSEELPGPLRPVPPVAAVLVFVALLVALILGISPNIDTQLVALGEWIWPGYANELRMDPEPPDCDLADLDQRLAACPEEGAAGVAPADGGTPADPFAGEDPFAEEAAAPEAPSGEGAGGDPFAGEDPFAEEVPSRDAPAAGPTATECRSLRAFRETCQARHDQYDAVQARLNPTNRAYRTVEVFIGDLAKFPYWKHLLSLLVVLGALATTVHRMPIALRTPRTLAEHRLSQVLQLLAHLLLAASCAADFVIQVNSDAEAQAPELSLVWAVGVLLLAIVNVVHLIRPPAMDPDQGTSPARLLMVIPLYAYMIVGSGLYFWLVELHPSGQAIYLHQFLAVPSVYLGIGLYLWAGMLFSITRFATLVFGVLRPLGLPPVLLAWLVVVLAAVPTAYSGASGIFVLAAGAVVFTQLRRSGASSRIALAATAMSGSLGVVLAPCLVVVLIATLNNDVTTAELFGGGLWVFGLTALLALIAFLVRNDQPFRLPEDLGGAAGDVGRALWALVPFVAIGAAVMLIFAYVFGTDVSEHTAMLVLPAVLLAIVTYDRAFAPDRIEAVPLPRPRDGLWRPVIDATAESSDHIGALLMLMVGSIALGGVVERTELMALFPASLGGPYLTMAVLVVVMVIVGMTMDALGAVVLVSVSLAGLAMDAGIHPVHFWLMVLVAFELGYLTPPVALNHLLARQVIGEESHVEDDGTRGFWARHEHLVLPMVVMAVALILVAFGGFAFWPVTTPDVGDTTGALHAPLPAGDVGVDGG